MNLFPESARISEAVGRWYLGQRGSTTLLLLNSVHLGLAPSISSMKRGSDSLVIILLWLGMGST